MMILRPRTTFLVLQRNFKNFGHKTQPVPGFTTVWHGFLTFTFIGFCLDWNKIGSWIFGPDFIKKNEDSTLDRNIQENNVDNKTGIRH